MDLIGLTLDEAEKILDNKGLKYEIVYNNSNKQKSSDTVLVTNVKFSVDKTIIYVSDFLFNVR